jgi:hypothetical protein
MVPIEDFTKFDDGRNRHNSLTLNIHHPIEVNWQFGSKNGEFCGNVGFRVSENSFYNIEAKEF